MYSNKVSAMATIDTDMKFQIFKDQQLGRGTYGEVFKARCDGLPCAAKVFYIDSCDLESTERGKKIMEECRIMKASRHPCIIQYLGVVRDPSTQSLVLLMELASQTLTTMLRTCLKPPAQRLQVDLSRDIALVIAYLHQNKILHGDLSSNNILITAGGRKAKVCDFGTALMLDERKEQDLIVLPGTMVYMPPEALPSNQISPIYSYKLDCFSLGVLIVQICTGKYPRPSPALREVISEANVSNTRKPKPLERVPEIERRKTHLNLIDSSNSLLPLAMECLSDAGVNRPSAEQICQYLEDIKI